MICPSDELLLQELVEDELILALPIIARHENDSECRPYTAEEPGGDGYQPDKPLAALASLKGQLGNS